MIWGTIRGAAHTGQAVHVPRTNNAARTAVGVVPGKVDAIAAAAVRSTRRALTTCPLIAVRPITTADVAAGAAVDGIPHYGNAGTVAEQRAIDALVETRAIDARAVLMRTRRITDVPAASAVVEVLEHINARTVATSQPTGAARVVSAGSTEAARVAAAGLTGRQALRPLRLRTLIAEGFTRVRSTSLRGSQRQRERHQRRTGKHGPQPPQ